MAFTLASSTTIAPMMTLAAGSSASHIWGQVPSCSSLSGFAVLSPATATTS